MGGSPLNGIDPLGLIKYTQVPANAVQYVSGSGVSFNAPPRADFSVVLSEGSLNGSNLLSLSSFEGQGGMNDYQRFNGDFYSAYTNASNYGVGVYMYGAGFSADQMIGISETFATLFSSNAGDPTQVYWWLQGWQDAANGTLAKRMGCQ